MSADTHHQGVRAVHVRAGHAEKGGEVLGHVPEQPGLASIGKQANGDFGHGDPGPLRHQAILRCGEDPETTAHDDAVAHRYHRLGKGVNLVVEAIFPLEELKRVIVHHLSVLVVPHHCMVERLDVAPGAESAITGAGEENGDHLRPFGPAAQCREHDVDHLQAERVQRGFEVEPRFRKNVAARGGVLEELHGRIGCIDWFHAGPTR